VFLLLTRLRTLPGLYKWSIKSRVYRHCAHNRSIDEATAETDAVQQPQELETELAELNREIAKLRNRLANRKG